MLHNLGQREASGRRQEKVHRKWWAEGGTPRAGEREHSDMSQCDCGKVGARTESRKEKTWQRAAAAAAAAAKCEQARDLARRPRAARSSAHVCNNKRRAAWRGARGSRDGSSPLRGVSSGVAVKRARDHHASRQSEARGELVLLAGRHNSPGPLIKVAV